MTDVNPRFRAVEGDRKWCYIRQPLEGERWVTVVTPVGVASCLSSSSDVLLSILAFSGFLLLKCTMGC